MLPFTNKRRIEFIRALRAGARTGHCTQSGSSPRSTDEYSGAALRIEPPTAAALTAEQLETDCFGIQLLRPAESFKRDVALDVVRRSVQLIGVPALLRPSQFAFNAKIERFVFDAPRSEPKQRSLFAKAPVRLQRRSSRNDQPIEDPPDLDKKDRKELLRWLLTPPATELLCDPDLALPEMPFPYQRDGIRWLHDRDSALLADEMGLGKTMQAIIAARLLWRSGAIKHVLVICPKSLVPNWRAELRMWWPCATLLVYAPGNDREWFLKLATKNVTVKIIHYEALQGGCDWLADSPLSHDLVIIDEAQRIKNASSKTAQSVKQLRGGRSWALTGTPLENRIDDLFSIFEFVCPGLLDPSSQWHVAELIRPYMLRRRTNDPEVNIDLPERIDHNIALDLEESQRESYRRAEKEGISQLEEKGDGITITHVFQLIQRLRQICNFDPESGKSAKLEMILEEFEEIAASRKKALIFSQFTSDQFGLKRIAIELSKTTKPLLLHGEIGPTQREANIDRFRSDDTTRILLLNYAVGGVGLNLQAASYVYLFDRWWNPAVEDQAVKRSHRLGQKQIVIVKRFYCRETIEERILVKLEEKRRLFATIIDEGRDPSQNMGLSEEEFFQLFNLKVRPRRASADQPAAPRIRVQQLDPDQFEELVRRIYEAQGYVATRCGRSHDGGVDVIAERALPGGRDRIAIQCKRWDGSVGRPELQKLWGIAHDDPSITRVDLVTTSRFSAEAADFANGKRIGLIDGTQLRSLIARYNVAVIQEADS